MEGGIPCNLSRMRVGGGMCVHGRGDTNLARERWGRGGGGGHHPFQDERGTQT